MDQFPTKVKKSCDLIRCALVVLAIALFASVVTLAVLGSECNTKWQTCKQTCNPEYTEPLVQKLVAQEKLNGIVLLVDYENTQCKDNFCSVCHTDVLLHQNHSTIPCPESISNRGCPNCTVLLTKGGKTEINCSGYNFQDAKCLAQHTCREEKWCNEGFPVINLTSETTWELICQCPPGKRGPGCEEKHLSTFRCDCYSSPLKVSGWSVLPRCDNLTFSEEPKFCRLKVVDNSTNTENQCACSKSDKNQTDIEAKCAVAP